MKDFELLDALGGIRENYVMEAEERGAAPRQRLLRWSMVAACLGLAALAVVLGSWEVFRSRLTPILGTTTTGLGSAAATPAGTVSAAESTPAPAIAETGSAGISIPALELPETPSGAEADMIGLVVYRGCVYTDAGSWRGEEARALDALTGEYLGDCVGSIDEWSGSEAWEQEFAGTVPGEVHTVTGYDPDFRLCVRQEYVDDEGEPQLWIMFLERLNGVTLSAGADLFEERLRLRGRVDAVQWQDHDDWNYARGNYRDAALGEETWDAFLEALDESTFVNAWDPERRFYDETHPTIYDTDHQTHLYLRLEDGSTAALRLIAGGYVGYRGLGWYFVRIPGEIFDTVYAACGGK